MLGATGEMLLLTIPDNILSHIDRNRDRMMQAFYPAEFVNKIGEKLVLEFAHDAALGRYIRSGRLFCVDASGQVGL